MSNEIVEEKEDVPLGVSAISLSDANNPGASITSSRQTTEHSATTDWASTVNSVYASATSFFNKSANEITEATKNFPSTFKHLAEEGTTMVNKLRGGLQDFIAHGIVPDGDEQWEPTFEDLQKTLTLSASDSLIGSFVCHLLQNYTSTDNIFSPDIKIPFPAMISVTEQAICIVIKYENSRYPAMINKEDVVDLSSEGDVLLLKLTEERQVSFTRFLNEESKIFASKLLQQHTPST